ncbi:MAG: hypothetical protein BWX81_01852 [Spirochaetes bacterium ADurb.Bin110]|nr:MAG: hypothetical protein BWX81_01852 [Spirochaetes bacterium ADurb.Bin110]
MKTIRRIITCLLLAIFISAFYGQEKEAAYSTTLTTNLAYLTLSAISCSKNSALVIVPVYCEIMLNDFLGVNPSTVVIYTSNVQTSHYGLMILAELGITLHPNKKGHAGFVIGIIPGIVYSFDSNISGYTISANAGYQWLIKDRLVINTTLGGRYINIDGQMLIPDLGINIGYKIR